MTRKNILIGLGTLIGIIGLIYFYRYFKSINEINQAKIFVEQVKLQHKRKVDSLQNAFNYEDEIHFRINQAIHNNDFNTAYQLMDSLPAFGRKSTILEYEGMILEKQGDYNNALKKYDSAVHILETPLNLILRGELNIKMNKFTNAISDYKKAFKYNYDYSKHIGEAFELMNQQDSALKYYLIYSEHYPSDTFIINKINALSK